MSGNTDEEEPTVSLTIDHRRRVRVPAPISDIDGIPADVPRFYVGGMRRPTTLEHTIRASVADEVRRVLGKRDPAPAVSSVVMTADDVAAFLGVDRKTVYDYANRGQIPSRRLGKRVLFSRDHVVAWLKGESASVQRGT